ncbi:MAG TPA: ATP-binding protein [Longimicrobium sp.]|nr:ATP-binding protein [Longimicrobium sp.]
MKNPFEFGRELGAAELVDRREEVRQVADVLREGGKLFVIGPRRFGKTSILKAAEELAARDGVLVLRYDAEAYPALALLAQAIIADATRALTRSVEKAREWIVRFFGGLRPSVNYDVLQQSWSVQVGAGSAALPAATALLVDVLAGLDALAGESGRPVGVVIDEFQHVVEQEGIAAEQQIRAAIQKHRHVAYVFAGSKTRFLSDMTGDPARPFYRLGSRMFVREVPRPDFEAALRDGFARAGFGVEPEGVAAILDRAEDVPYNVQRLAHFCWNALRDGAGSALTPALVDATLDRLVRQDDPFYTQLWNGLNRTQQKALVAVVRESGTEVYSQRVARSIGLSVSTIQTAVRALERAGMVRVDEALGATRLRLEDPFFAAWLRVIGTL